MAASLSERENEEEREEEPEPNPGVPGEQSPSEEHQVRAPRALSSARKRKAGLVSPKEEATGEEEWKSAPKKQQLLDSDEEDTDERGGQAVSGTLRIRKKKRFLIEDEDEDY